jgi:2-methylcitrate dehydratase PrpD
LVLNKIDLHAFTADTLRDPRIAALAEKTFCTADADAPEDQSKGWVIVETTDGRRIESVATNCAGSEANPMSPDEVRRKFRDNLAFAGLGANADRIINAVDRFETLESIAPLIALCCRAS